MPKVRLPRWRTLLLVFSAFGIVNAMLVLRPFTAEHVPPVPMSVAIAPVQGASPVGLRAYISIAKTRTVPAAERDRVHAAIMFISYFLMSTRALGAECDNAGEDLATAKAAFANAHRPEYDRASTFLSSHGVNSDILWHLFKSDLTGLANEHLGQYASRFKASRAETCARLAAEPERFVAMRHFPTAFPDLHQLLMR
jgi:hypothetical protein